MKVSVLIVAHERPAHVRACLRALTLQSVPPAQVVVVDDGSGPESVARMRSAVSATALPEATLVSRVRDGYCPAAARNEAARHARHDYLLFLDCDILPFPDAIERHLRVAAPRRFLVGHCAYLDETASAEFLRDDRWTAAELRQAWCRADTGALCRGASLFRRYALLRRFGLAPRHKPKLLSGHFSLHRADFQAVNGFDENYVGWGYEDDDLGMRLYRAGLQSRSVALEARALHVYHPSAKQVADFRSRPNRAYFRRRGVTTRCWNGLEKEAGGARAGLERT